MVGVNRGYVDLQVNGIYGVDFNSDSLQSEEVASVCCRLRDDGVAGILATIITDDLKAMCHRLRRIRVIRGESESIRDMIWGIHIEGPFLNSQPGFIGAHPAWAVSPAECDKMERLLDAAGDLVRIVTLAPEQDPECNVIRMLVSRGIRVAAGHCDTSLEQLCAAIDAGLSMFTHLGNGCPLWLHRHDNIIQRVLSLSDQLWIGFIPDGVHVPMLALKNYLRLVGVERSFVVTDAIQAAGLGQGTYNLAAQSVIVDEQLATWSADRSHLIGSASNMSRLVNNLRMSIGLSDADIERLTSINPRQILGREISVN